MAMEEQERSHDVCSQRAYPFCFLEREQKGNGRRKGERGGFFEGVV
jgi:hypothetical protein